MALSPGTRLGPYEVGAQIGAGGMGEVYRARDRRLARDVAIKALPAALATEEDRLARLQHEARILASLNHPNIGTIYGLEESANAIYLVLELVEGETLDQRLSRTGPMATAAVLRIAAQLADALEVANAAGITHRDIKPSNIKLTPEGRVKVLDFGLARSVSRREIQDDELTRSTSLAMAPLTEVGGVVGTPPYMSPEQIRGQVTDQRTDVWAFGCVVFELLCGRRPFRGSTVPDLLAAILQSEPDWSAVPADVPEDMRTLLRKCLEKDVSRRWQNFSEVRTELARAISAQTGHEHARPWVILLSGGLSVALTVALLITRPELLVGLEYSVYDRILRWSSSAPPDQRVVIVDVDERSLAAIGQWPWRRDVIGRLIDRLRDLGAATIALDMFFAEADQSREVGATDAESIQRRTPDELLADSLRRGRVVLGYGLTFDKSAATASNECELHALNLSMPAPPKIPDSPDAPFFEATRALCPVKVLAVAADSSGFLNAAPDPDGVLRRAPLVMSLNGRVYPSLAVAAVLMATATRDATLRVAAPNRVSFTLGDQIVPLDGRSNLLLRYRGPKGTFPYVSAADVMAGLALPTSIQNKIVFVGTTALGNRNVAATPLDALFVGVEVEATIADNLLQHDFIRQPPRLRMFETLAVAGLGLTITLLATTVGLSASALAAAVGLGALWIGSVALLTSNGVFVSPLYPTVAVLFAFFAAILGHIAFERRRARTAIRKVESIVLNR